MSRILPVLLLLVSSPVWATDPVTITGKVVAVADGDTLTVLDVVKNPHKIRLHGIDAPEKAQAFGTKAKKSLATLVFQKDVTVTVVDTDRYGRMVGKVKRGDLDVNLALVKGGWCWRYTTYDKKSEYAAAQAEARAARRGLWADSEPIPPWEFRRRK
jgi:endonuclease YncB( thermonuclease family)